MPAQVPFALLLVVLLVLRGGGAERGREPPARVGIIGAGIGGTSAAYYLQQEFGGNVRIDVFERGEVGGRMATMVVDGKGYEEGGEFTGSGSQHLMHFVKELGLPTVPRNYRPLGVFSGDEIVFAESYSSIIWNLPKYFWHYGLSLLKLLIWGLEKSNLGSIYNYQSQGHAFTKNQDLLRAMGGASFEGLLNETIAEAMQKAGVSQKFIDQIVTPFMRINYGQNDSIHASIGGVSLLALGSGLWSVKGGNRLVCRGLLSASKAELIPTTVLSVEQKTQQKGRSGDPVQQYEVTYQSESGVDTRLYDILLIATPLEPGMANITFQNFNPPIPPFSRPYVQVVVTLVNGCLNAPYFGYKDPSQLRLTSILTMENPKIFMFGMVIALPVEKPRPKPSSDPTVWKVLSPDPLSKEQLDLLFSSYDTVEEKVWQAFPRYQAPEKVPPIVLHDHMYYLNGIEYIASAMEMSAIAGKNAALLAHHRWHGKLDKVDQEDLLKRLREEV